ncbi:hypothetical protein AKJ43_00690 [candidate division MSBL1 archaeon SCGC-AAA261D19]|uniref:Acetyl-CoA decarbonylase/synthase complex subunit delta n=1 Tax=candidate division MSBL1 archaeon SCGC-AAA261D19 TaxID=1698273 RepID=A0A133V8F9_9EURY|nr:hypothetical protein AKJ43_00690 [candidate division MSBL1 archaeon SCGC-AAA261D19]
MRIRNDRDVRRILKELAVILDSIDLNQDKLEFEGLEIDAEEIELETTPQASSQMISAKPAEKELEIKKFEPILKEWPQPIEEVPMGATKTDGGTRTKVVKLGGEKSMPFYPDAENPNKPVIAFDIFDSKIHLPSVISKHFEEVMDDPGEWAKKSVNEFDAEMVTIHLTSTDPKGADTTPKEAAKSVEEVLEAVDVPIVVGGSGNPEKDPKVLKAAAEVAEDERCLLASATLDLDWKTVADAAMEHNHNVLAWTTMDINLQKELNRKLLSYGVDRDRIVMDPTTAALGYGIEYSISAMQRIRMGGLGGDEELNFPISNGVTNAWGAREAWMRASKSREKYGEEWGPRKFRGPMWEVCTGLSMLLSGSNLLMELHPRAVVILKEVINRMLEEDKEMTLYNSWITM